MRTVLFGVDGLTFRVLDPLIERGDLPNFRMLREKGCASILESSYPPVTPAAWTSISTGMKPASHGVYDFWEYEGAPGGSARNTHVQTHRKGARAIWNILSDYHKQVLVINVPITYPPEAVNGIMISGYLTPGSDAAFTYPHHFKQELYHVVPDYKIDLEHEDMFSMKLTGKPGPLIDATMHMTERRIQLLLYLMQAKPWDFCYVVFVGADRLQHPLWQDIISLDTRTTAYFRLLDHALGLILEQLRPEDTLFVVSDHGFQGATQFFDINEYLYSKGLLKLTAGNKRIQFSRHTTAKRTLRQAGLLPLARRAKKLLKQSGAIQDYAGDVLEPVLVNIDWRQTRAYVPSMSCFLGGYADIFMAPDLDETTLLHLCEDLKTILHPRTKQPLIESLYTTDVFGTGPFAPREPHLLLLPSNGITFRPTLGNTRLWDEASAIRGIHHKDGVLFAYGGDIKQGFKAPNAEIYDIVPTILHSMRLPLPIQFDGHVLDELFQCNTQREEQSSNLVKNKLNKLYE